MREHKFDTAVFGALLIEIGIALQSAGASSSRIRITMTRFAQARKLEPHFLINPKSISLTLMDANGVIVFNGLHSVPLSGVNFKILSGISILSWRFVEEDMSVEEVREELDRLQSVKHYPRWLVLTMVSLAGAAFCFTFSGDIKQMAITFLSTFVGLFTSQELKKRKFNLFLCTYLSALVAALTTGVFYAAGIHLNLEQAFSTCVLFLIPGVPLINAFSDLIEGQILYGIERGTTALIHIFSIAAGLSTAMLIYNING